MTLKERWATRILAKKTAKEKNEQQERIEQQISWNARKTELLGWSKKFVESKREEFKAKVKPLFSIDDKALTNWYGRGDGWEGSVESLQNHTPYRGPIEVKIKGVFVDSSELSEKFYNMIDMNQRDLLMSTYKEFEKFAKKRMSKWECQTIWWSYIIRVTGDDKVYWTYTWRENKLLALTSKEAKYSIKAWKTDVKLSKLFEKKKILEKKLRDQVEKANHVTVIFV